MTGSSYAPLTGFGDDENWSVKFTIEFPGNALPQWQGGMERPTFDIPDPTGGPIRRIGQVMGRLPRTVSWRLWFDCIADYDRMDALQGYRSTLRYIWGITPAMGGTKATIGSVSYLVLADTLLESLSEPIVDVDGTVEATATFERPYVAPPVVEPQPWPEPPKPIPLPMPLFLLALDGDLEGVVT